MKSVKTNFYCYSEFHTSNLQTVIDNTSLNIKLDVIKGST